MRIIERHTFGPHEVLVVEYDEDEDTFYSVLVDGVAAEERPLRYPPSFELVVRLYDRSLARWPSAESRSVASA